MRFFVFRKLRQTENTHHVNICIIYHQSNVANIAGYVYHVFSNLSPKYKINEYLEYFFHRVKVNCISLSLNAIYYHDVQALIINDYLQKLLVFRKKRHTSTRQLLIHLVFFSQKVKESIDPTIFYKFTLEF
jgi:hypothetical protein